MEGQHNSRIVNAGTRMHRLGTLDGRPKSDRSRPIFRDPNGTSLRVSTGMARGHTLGNVGNNLGNAADDVRRKHLIRMKHAQGLSVVVLFGHHKDHAAKAKVLRPMYTSGGVCYQPPLRWRWTDHVFQRRRAHNGHGRTAAGAIPSRMSLCRRTAGSYL
jgi:hypothetical protein